MFIFDIILSAILNMIAFLKLAILIITIILVTVNSETVVSKRHMRQIFSNDSLLLRFDIVPLQKSDHLVIRLI